MMMLPMLPLLPLLAASTVAWPPVNGNATAFGLGKNDAALVAAVSKPFVLPEIPGAADNGTDWYRWLVVARGIPVDNVRLLRDGDVTREALLAEAEAMQQAVKPGGTLWVIFIGHGAPDSTGADGLLLGVDVQPSWRSVVSRGLPQQELLRTVVGDGSHAVVAVFDACFSGVASDGSHRALVPGSQTTLPVRRVDPVGKVTVLSASEQVAGPLPGHDRPAFSYLLLGAARGWGDANHDATVTIDEAFDYTRTTLATMVRDRNQTPTLRGAGGNVVLSKRATERGPDLGQAVIDTSSPASSPASPSASSSASSKRPDRRGTFDVVAAQAEFNKRRLAATSDGFSRGPFGEKVSLARGAAMGRDGAPGAAAVIDEIESMRSTATITSIIAGTVVGVAAGTGTGLLIGTQSSGSDALVVGGAVGTLVGAGVGGVTWAIVDAAMGPSDTDLARLSRAKDDVADAVNDAERKQLGLVD
jgi:hypothetical protein